MVERRHNSDIAQNVRVHNKIANKYERLHGEIYNEIEQARLRDVLKRAMGSVRSETRRSVALDFGCGAGNLTRHLSELGCDVLACDVSVGFLDLIESRPHRTNVTTMRLNGHDLSNVDDQSVDLIATYSVLHHVPDYLGILSEFIRVLKPGGVLFIDHELCTDYWLQPDIHTDFYTQMSGSVGGNWRKYFRWENYKNWFIWKFINPRYRSEGDIHVFPDDHIEWEKVVVKLQASSVDILYESDYLLFKRGYDVSVYEKYKPLISDMHCLIAQKRRDD